jgi:isoleucyl-tRNA synthetase
MSRRFHDVKAGFNFPELEERVLEFWRERDVFRRSVEARRDAKPFIFLEGPPTANGRPGVHHILARVMKDIICRYKTMTGHYVARKAGWDTHGLPVEIEVEKQLGLDGKKQIEEYGIREFVEACKKSVFVYEQDWRKTTERIAFWVDMDDPYITLTNDYIESVWAVFRRFWDAGLFYEGHKVVPYCPRCGTALSSHEVAQGYKEVEDPSVYVRFHLKDDPKTSFLVWTTTPWTLPSNVALAVRAEAEYAYVRHGDETLILAKSLLERVFTGHGEPELLRTVSGEALVGAEYVPMFRFIKPNEKAFYVVTADFVTLDDGTGIVHIAPAFGQDDYEIGRRHGLPLVQLVDTEGRFVAEVEPWAKRFVKDADPHITEHLCGRGDVFKTEGYVHDYPFCWRCDSPLLYYARGSWFIKTTAYKDRMVELNARVNWYPDHIREGRFGDWLENNVDWAVSRERYWGTPLPIWKCVDCGHTHCVGSGEELRRLGRNAPDALEYHRPYIDAVEMDCPMCGGTMRRIPEVADAWFDSGCAHTAQWHAPFENEDAVKRNYPADFICEAIDQTRGWFYSLLATGAFLYDGVAYRNCLCLEHVLGADGLKMSKSRGNAVDPWTVLNKQGADAIRWYFYSVAPPWQRRVFSEEAVNESLKGFLGTLYNVYGFLVLYANADGINPTENVPEPGTRPLMDRWILSRFHSTVTRVREEMEDYQITFAARALEEFVDDLSNWYVRRCRDRFWGTAASQDASEKAHRAFWGVDRDKQAAFGTLYETLVGTAAAIAPFTPFLAEEMYQNLVRSVNPNAPESVHLCDFPAADASLIDTELETAMALARKVVRMGLAARNEKKIRVRQPLSRIVVGGLDNQERQSLASLLSTVLDELNVKSLEWGDMLSDFADTKAKANFKTLGPKYGKDVQTVARALATHPNVAALRSELASTGATTLEVDGRLFPLDAADVLVSLESHSGFAVVQEEASFVALDTTLTPELAQEGLARELVNRIQAMRKEADFVVTDRIALTVQGTPAVEAAFERFRDYVVGETLAVRVDEQPSASAFVKEHRIGEENATLSVVRVSLYPETQSGNPLPSGRG